MSGDPSQESIWTHFQREDAAYAFQAARPRHAAILRKLQRLAQGATPAVLNIGVGDGNFERIVRQRGWAISSLDPDADAVRKLCEHGVQAKAGYIDALPFADSEFDFVVASEVLEHLTPAERQAGLREIQRVLKPGGHFVGTVPYQEELQLNITVCPKCRHAFHRWGHTTAFDLATLRLELVPYFNAIGCHCTAFVEFRGQSLRRKLKSLIRLILAKSGAAIAVPSIFFVCRKA